MNFSLVPADADYGQLTSHIHSVPIFVQSSSKEFLLFCKGCKNPKEYYTTETIHGPRSVKYLLSGHLQKKFAKLSF